MGNRDYFKSSDWSAICDRCGFKFKASELKLDWQGFRVCEDDFEYRHPQDFLKPKTDKIFVPWARPDFAIEIDSFLITDTTTLNGAAINTFMFG